jgi:hypothetical protein
MSRPHIGVIGYQMGEHNAGFAAVESQSAYNSRHEYE